MFLFGGGFTAIVLVLTTSIVTLQTGVFPQWLAWLGFVAAFALLFAIIFLPMLALLIWVLVVSVSAACAARGAGNSRGVTYFAQPPASDSIRRTPSSRRSSGIVSDSRTYPSPLGP